MKVLYFSRDYTPHDHRFLSALAKTEHEVVYLRLERRGHALEDRPLPEGIREIHWAGGQQPARLQDGARLLFDFKRVIREQKPDLVHAGPIQRAAFLVALAGFQPLVSMSWGYDLLQDVGRGPLWRWATRVTLRSSAAMVGDCDTIRRIAIEHGMAPDRIITFPWGIDLRHFAPANHFATEDNDHPFVLLSTRSWEPIYGVDLIAKAFARIASGRPNMRLVMLGNGSQAASLHSIFTKAGVMDQVYFPGQVGHTALPGYYRSASLYLSASHSDGTSISLLEALACGCPVLVSDIPGNREWVTPGKQGYLFADGNVDSLSERLLYILENRKCLPELSLAARELAVLRADWEVNFPNLLKAYRLAFDHRSALS